MGDTFKSHGLGDRDDTVVFVARVLPGMATPRSSAGRLCGLLWCGMLVFLPEVLTDRGGGAEKLGGDAFLAGTCCGGSPGVREGSTYGLASRSEIMPATVDSTCCEGESLIGAKGGHLEVVTLAMARSSIIPVGSPGQRTLMLSPAFVQGPGFWNPTVGQGVFSEGGSRVAYLSQAGGGVRPGPSLQTFQEDVSRVDSRQGDGVWHGASSGPIENSMPHSLETLIPGSRGARIQDSVPPTQFAVDSMPLAGGMGGGGGYGPITPFFHANEDRQQAAAASSATPVPEPSGALLLGSSLILFFAWEHLQAFRKQTRS